MFQILLKREKLKVKPKSPHYFFLFRQSKSLLSSFFSNVTLVPAQFPCTACAGKIWLLQPIYLSHTLHPNQRDNLCFDLFNFLGPRIWVSYLFACFCVSQIKKWKKYLQSSMMSLRQFLPKESIYTFSMSFFSIPLVKILLPQFTRSTAHWKHGWAYAKTEFHIERGTGGSNQGSRLTCEAKSKIHYRIGKNQYLQRSREKKDHITFRKLEVVQKVKMNIRFPSAPTCLQAPLSEISMPRVSYCHSNVFSI